MKFGEGGGSPGPGGGVIGGEGGDGGMKKYTSLEDSVKNSFI